MSGWAVMDLECARQKKQKISKVQWENCSVI